MSHFTVTSIVYNHKSYIKDFLSYNLNEFRTSVNIDTLISAF